MLATEHRSVRAAADAPFYRALTNEVEVFQAAARRGLPVLLKGPTGCGKTRFVEAMAYELGRNLITVAGHEDLTSADLVGRFLLRGGEGGGGVGWVGGGGGGGGGGGVGGVSGGGGGGGGVGCRVVGGKVGRGRL